MAVSYDKLWKLLVDKKMKKAELRRIAGISSNTLTRMNNEEPVSLELLTRVCEKLDCDFCDIVSYVPGKEETKRVPMIE